MATQGNQPTHPTKRLRIECQPDHTCSGPAVLGAFRRRFRVFKRFQALSGGGCKGLNVPASA
eukprot:14508907-Alexandrium_andersonii.AAC.1